MVSHRPIASGLPAAILLMIAPHLVMQRAHAQGCSDDFTGPALGAPWKFLDADGGAGGGYALAGGKLELTGRGRDAFKEVNEFVGVWRSDIAGDFDVSVKIESQANTHGWAQAGILAAADLSDLSKGGYVVVDASPANGYNFFYDSAEPIGSLDKVIMPGAAPGYPVWLRLAKSGTRFSAWYRKAAGDPWTGIAKDITPLGAAVPSRIALFSLSHNANMDGKAVFDDFACLHAPSTVLGAGSTRTGLRSTSVPAFQGNRNVAGRRNASPRFFPAP